MGAAAAGANNERESPVTPLPLRCLLSLALAAGSASPANAQTIDWPDEGLHHFQRADCRPLSMSPSTLRCERKLPGATFTTWMNGDGFWTATAEVPNTREGAAEALDYFEMAAPWREKGAPESFDRGALLAAIANELSNHPLVGVGCLAWLIQKNADTLSFQIDRRGMWQVQAGPAPATCWVRAPGKASGSATGPGSAGKSPRVRAATSP